MNNLKIAGLLFYLSGAIVLMGIITAEALYPSGYTTFKNEISDLGATKQPNSVSFEPSSSIFNSIMWLSGLMILTATFYQHKYFKSYFSPSLQYFLDWDFLALAFSQATSDLIME